MMVGNSFNSVIFDQLEPCSGNWLYLSFIMRGRFSPVLATALSYERENRAVPYGYRC